MIEIAGGILLAAAAIVIIRYFWPFLLIGGVVALVAFGLFLVWAFMTRNAGAQQLEELRLPRGATMKAPPKIAPRDGYVPIVPLTRRQYETLLGPPQTEWDFRAQVWMTPSQTSEARTIPPRPERPLTEDEQETARKKGDRLTPGPYQLGGTYKEP